MKSLTYLGKLTKVVMLFGYLERVDYRMDNATGSLPQSLRKSGYELPLYPFINSECASLKDPRDRNFA
ncbi:unnamed protein product [Schistosoma haematobium]|nr:unnamed protein product [Schistosoma haematobium]